MQTEQEIYNTKRYLEDIINRHLNLGTPFVKGLLEELEDKIAELDHKLGLW